jgi:hypothetical protein
MGLFKNAGTKKVVVIANRAANNIISGIEKDGFSDNF